MGDDAAPLDSMLDWVTEPTPRDRRSAPAERHRAGFDDRGEAIRATAW
jgi:hypothetical protein